MFDCDTVFARHGKFNRSALARLVTWDHLRGTTWQRRNLAKLLAKAKIAEKDVLSQMPSSRPSMATQVTSELVPRLHSCCVTLPPLLGLPVGSIAADSSLLYRIPLPDELDDVRTLRAITITLA